MLSDLYSDALLDAAASLPPARALDQPSAQATKTSRVCGSEVAVELRIADGAVADFSVDARACALGQAAAGLVATRIVGATTEELRRLRDAVRAMLKDGGPPPVGEAWDPRWRDLSLLQAIRDYPQRHASTLLVFDAVVACIERHEADERGA